MNGHFKWPTKPPSDASSQLAIEVAHHDLVIVEASPEDWTWGIGCDRSDPKATQPGTEGKNFLAEGPTGPGSSSELRLHR